MGVAGASSSLSLFAPLLADEVSTHPGRAAARTVRGISDRASSAIERETGTAVPFSLVEPHSPAAGRLRRAISGLFDRTETLRDAASALYRTIKYGTSNTGGQLDDEAIVEQTKALAAAVNDLRDFVEENPDSLASGLLDKLSTPTGSYDLRQRLGSIGVTVESGGWISVDESVLRENLASRPEYVAAALGQASGLARTELDTANELLGGSTVSVLGFSNFSGPSYLLSDVSHSALELSGNFVNLLA